MKIYMSKIWARSLVGVLNDDDTITFIDKDGASQRCEAWDEAQADERVRKGDWVSVEVP